MGKQTLKLHWVYNQNNMPKNPMYVDKIIISGNSSDGGIFMADGTSVVDSSGNIDAPVTSTDLTLSGSCSVGTTLGVTGAATLSSTLGVTGLTTLAALTTDDVQAGGASNGPLIKKSLQAGEAYTGTTAGLSVKNYGDATATVPSGEFTGLYVNLKGLHVDPGNNTSLISAHVHASNTTTVHAGLWLYGDMTNGVKASGSTLSNLLDISEATSITTHTKLAAAGTDKVVEANTGTPGACNYIIRFELADGTPIYVPAYTSKPS